MSNFNFNGITSNYINRDSVGSTDTDVYTFSVQTTGTYLININNPNVHGGVQFGTNYLGLSGNSSIKTGFSAGTTYTLSIGADTNEEYTLSIVNTSGSDNQKPSKPTSTNNSVSGSTATLTWSGATDNVGITGYEVIYSNDSGLLNARIKSATGEKLSVTGLSKGTWYWRVRARDAAGNWSAWTDRLGSFTISASTLETSTAPSRWAF